MSIKYNFLIFTTFALIIHQNVYCTQYDPCDPCQKATLDYCCQYEHKCCDVHWQRYRAPGKAEDVSDASSEDKGTYL
ncbi:hypothetical protein WA026_014565 [Henosepilachna vigintioctopunctata]|uniref:Uncharacterized protein n=1 Tax=Henosepilachna vigintioctopunctata TaxID=420089 RepID=A0AAW1V841_9CUCU